MVEISQDEREKIREEEKRKILKELKKKKENHVSYSSHDSYKSLSEDCLKLLHTNGSRVTYWRLPTYFQ